MHEAHCDIRQERQPGRLAYEGVHAGVEGTLVRLRRLVGTQDDDYRGRGVATDKCRQIQPIGGAVATQLHVDDGNAILIGRQVFKGLFRARGAVDGVTLLRKVLPEAENDALFVVDYKNSFHATPAFAKSTPESHDDFSIIYA
jgi:hypothetical protein